MGDIVPQQTLYINNLYEKLRKEELKKCLFAVFSQFGKILDVVCLKTIRLRGQAWVVFADVTSATNAMKYMQGFEFFDKPMRLAFAKTKSDAVAKVDGSYSEKDVQARKKSSAAAREKHLQRGKTQAATTNPSQPLAIRAPGGAAGAEQLPPNKILFVQNLPENSTSSMLAMLFQQFPGFREVRMVDARPGISFVEFENDMQASVAMAGLQDFKITPAHAINISYAKQ